jgi:hypothetical protein
MTARRVPLPPAQTLEYVLGADPAVVRGFARAATDCFAAGPVTLRRRDELVRRGTALGLSRFDANLVLAAVERQVRASRPAMRLVAAETPPPGRAAAWVTVLGVQALIVAGAAWLVL